MLHFTWPIYIKEHILLYIFVSSMISKNKAVYSKGEYSSKPIVLFSLYKWESTDPWVYV